MNRDDFYCFHCESHCGGKCEQRVAAEGHWLPWSVCGVIVVAVLLVACCAGCSGISQAEWDDLQAKHKAALVSLEKADEERKIQATALVAARDALVKAKRALQRAADWFRANNGGVLPW